MILVRRWRNDNLTAYWDFLPKQLLTRDTFPEADLDLLQSKHMACPARGLAAMLPPVLVAVLLTACGAASRFLHETQYEPAHAVAAHVMCRAVAATAGLTE